VTSGPVDDHNIPTSHVAPRYGGHHFNRIKIKEECMVQHHLTTLDIGRVVLDVGPNAFVDPRSFCLGLENTTLP
jgi:hypothetical protein